LLSSGRGENRSGRNRQCPSTTTGASAIAFSAKNSINWLLDAVDVIFPQAAAQRHHAGVVALARHHDKAC
jgi:hypothetical protein